MGLHIQAYLCSHSLQKAGRQMLADVAYLPVNHLLVLQRDCLVDATLKLLPNRVNMFVIYPVDRLHQPVAQPEEFHKIFAVKIIHVDASRDACCIP